MIKESEVIQQTTQKKVLYAKHTENQARWVTIQVPRFTKHLMTGPRKIVSFLDPSTIEIEGKQKSLFHAGQVVKCFDIPLNSKIAKMQKNHLVYASWYTSLARFQGARHDHMLVKI